MAKTNDPSTWVDADTAIRVVPIHNFNGIGINLRDSDIVAFDIDKCRDSASGVARGCPRCISRQEGRHVGGGRTVLIFLATHCAGLPAQLAL